MENPVDNSINKSLFKKDDPLLKYYEAKYKFKPKDVRPFVVKDIFIKDRNPIYNDKLYEAELEKIV